LRCVAVHTPRSYRCGFALALQLFVVPIHLTSGCFACLGDASCAMFTRLVEFLEFVVACTAVVADVLGTVDCLYAHDDAEASVAIGNGCDVASDISIFSRCEVSDLPNLLIMLSTCRLKNTPPTSWSRGPQIWLSLRVCICTSTKSMCILRWPMLAHV
jgi:hypothetical protein